ncbi:MAG: ABC-F family ATP-binding cassette domain-containing protein [Elusimicrobia bacterium]|nr:ABC-F family ATP-binding cassette domain-containing protein [Elusimicrobiota bacterium]
MAILLSCQKISKTYGARPLFEGLSFGLSEGERTGLIGPNGTGKSTLLKILAGQEKPDDGELSVRRGLKVGYLAQQDHFGDAGALTVRQDLVRAVEGLGLEDYEVDIRVEAGLEDAGFPSPDQPVGTLSGGWRKRLAILAQVIREPDLLLLDEPTNHLDLEGVLWLERFLSGLKFSFLVVTHDRRFLERVSNRIIELNKRYPEGYFSSAGRYSDFLENREAFFSAQAAQEDTMRNIVRREVEWLRRGPKARTTKQKARIDRAGELMGELGELKYRNAQDRSVEIDFSGSERRTKKLAEAHQVKKSLGGRKLFGPLDLVLRPGDKLGLLGENGSGKSTLIKLLAGTLSPDSGTITHADRLQVVMFDQHREQLDLNMPLRRALCESGEHVYYMDKPVHVFSWADRFLFRKEQMDIPLGRLSGGEQSRVLIARLMLKPADLLFLDEPTNDLDINSLEVLETSLMEFPGALVLVTHDRHLLDRVSKEILALDGKGHARFFADLAQWEDWKAGQPESRPLSPQGKTSPVPEKPRPARSAKELKELKNMEAAIHAAEQEVEKARQALEDPSIATDAAELSRRHEKLTTAQEKIEALYKRWEDLEKQRP